MINPKLLKAYAAKMGGGATAADAEAEIILIATETSKNLGRIFRFGNYTLDDMVQEGILATIKVLGVDPPKYDVTRPIESFLYAHIHNRMHNLKRDHYMRLEPACKCCDPRNPPSYPCQRFLGWQARDNTKQNLMRHSTWNSSPTNSRRVCAPMTPHPARR
jgi:hypothetical protein